MKDSKSSGKVLRIVLTLLAGLAIPACSQTAAPTPNIVERAKGETPVSPPPSGFLGNDFSLLQPQSVNPEQKAPLAYTSPNANFASYTKIMIAPATFWADSDSKVSSADQQTHVLNIIKMGLTGTYAFVGSAPGEAKLTDSVSGELLAAWEDQQFGTAGVRNAMVWQWGDADNAMKYWANGLDQRLATLDIQHTSSTAQGS